MSRAHIESLMKMRCTVQRNTQTSADAYGHLEPATWTDHITEQRCWLYTRRGRDVIDGRVTAEVQELRAFVPLGTDIGTADRITSLEQDGTSINDRTFAVQSVERKPTHIELTLEAVY